MSAASIAASLRPLREQPQWQLLAATKAAPVLAVLRAVLLDGKPVLPGSVLNERVGRELDALRRVGSLMAPDTTATESRLATVIDQVTRLAADADARPERRIAALQAERDRIDREIAALRGGVVHTLAPDRAL